MELIGACSKTDPDYEKYNLALNEIEGSEEKTQFEELNKIIAEEFNRELKSRQQQLEAIEAQIFKAQKLLYLMRYVLVSSFYSKKNLEYTCINEYPSISGFDVQSRIHPAVKKLLGNNNFQFITARGKRKVHKTNEILEGYQPLDIKKTKLKKVETENITYNKTENMQGFLKRKKSKHRILIGNISKWMPSFENDNTTHKWMVYVRGLKETPNLSHLIEKVVFYLHPSYTPHNIVEVSQYPFHLSRRGWGEFPLRVQIFFKCALNKPISIVHHLKLDKTYTGRQTLGNETVVDIYLHDGNNSIKSKPNVPSYNELYQDFDENSDSSNIHSIPKNVICEESSIKKECIEAICYEDKFLMDHSYSLPQNSFNNFENNNLMVDDKKIDEKEQHNLIFDLEDLYDDHERLSKEEF